MTKKKKRGEKIKGKENKEKKILRRHTTNPRMKLSIPLERYRRDKFIDTMKSRL
jgi:hypothetical protein